MRTFVKLLLMSAFQKKEVTFVANHFGAGCAAALTLTQGCKRLLVFEYTAKYCAQMPHKNHHYSSGLPCTFSATGNEINYASDLVPCSFIYYDALADNRP